MDLIADIGATNSHCAPVNDSGQIVTTEVFSNLSSSIEALFESSTVGHTRWGFVSCEIMPKLIDPFLKSNFRNRFENKRTYRA
jgi:glucokinase